MKKIPLTQESLAKYNWQAIITLRKGGRLYLRAQRRGVKNGRVTTIKMHRQIMGFPAHRVDHADNNGLNNQRENLRPATHSQNIANSARAWKGASRWRGVTPYHYGKGRWVAQITINYKNHHLGVFREECDAAQAYNFAAEAAFGEYAQLNTP